MAKLEPRACTPSKFQGNALCCEKAFALHSCRDDLFSFPKDEQQDKSGKADEGIVHPTDSRAHASSSSRSKLKTGDSTFKFYQNKLKNLPAMLGATVLDLQRMRKLFLKYVTSRSSPLTVRRLRRKCHIQRVWFYLHDC